jgi:hypothetical protein
MTLFEHLSRLTYRQALKLLGPRGARLITDVDGSLRMTVRLPSAGAVDELAKALAAFVSMVQQGR